MDLLSLLTNGATAGVNAMNAQATGRQQKRDREQADLLARIEADAKRERDTLDADYKRSQIANIESQMQERSRPTPRNIDPLSPEGRAATLELERERAKFRPEAPRNIDPLSPEGIRQAVARQAELARTAPPRTSLPTEGERKAAGLLMTGENGFRTMHSLLGIPEDDPNTPQREDEAPGKEAPGFWNRQASRIGMGVGNIVSPEELRQMDQAAYDLSEAWLRLTSGAAIGEQEIANSAKAIIPQPGDDENTRIQKARSRRLRIEALRQAAGRARDPNVVGTADPFASLIVPPGGQP